MNKATKKASARPIFTHADWQIPAALIALTFVPFAAGVARVIGLAAGTGITPENARFFAAPLPVVVHIFSASLFCLLGAFQFAQGLRRRWPGWHRVAGRLLVASGIAAGLSGLWMTQFYPLAPHIQGNLLYGFRLLFGSAMIMSMVLGLVAIMRRDIAQHRAWMIRGYAIGQGAGTQVLVTLPWMLILGTPSELNRDILMGTAWMLNLAVAEWIIRRRLTYPQARSQHPVHVHGARQTLSPKLEVQLVKPVLIQHEWIKPQDAQAPNDERSAAASREQR